MECPICEKGKLARKKVEYSYSDWHIGEYDADVCSKCGETFFTEKSSDAIEIKVKGLGMWGMEKKTKISKSGNSLIVRVPKQIAELLKIREGDEAVIRPDGKKRMVIIAS
jgi:YgiT-type zinc finger domain-containing protein